MRKALKALLSLLAAELWCAVAGAQTQTAPQLAFESVPDFFKLPEDLHFGEVAGVAVNSSGHVFVFTRTNSANGPAFGPTAAALFEFDRNGKYLREVGKGLFAWAFAHSVRIDKDDNIWAIDKGSDMVVKMNPQGRVLWVFGRRKESADHAEPWEEVEPPLPAIDGLFRQPTDVAWDAAGNTYITDGYVNSRVAKYDRRGDWVMQWGSHGAGPGQFSTPHSIAIDAKDNIYVGDRANRRVQVFDTGGNYLREWSVRVPPDPGTRAVNGNTPAPGSMQGVGAPNSLCIPPGQSEVIFLGESTWPGRIFKLKLDGTVLGLIGRSGRNLKEFSGAHAIACPSANELFVAETSNWRVQKILLQP